MPLMTAKDRVAWIGDIAPWLETLKLADALDDCASITIIRVQVVKMIKRMYDLDNEAAIGRYNIMMESFPGLDKIEEREINDVLAGL